MNRALGHSYSSVCEDGMQHSPRRHRSFTGTRTVIVCFTLCDGVEANALTYGTANGTCRCIDPVEYYGSTHSSDDMADPSKTFNGYVAVDDSVLPRPSCNETRTFLKKLRIDPLLHGAVKHSTSLKCLIHLVKRNQTPFYWTEATAGVLICR